jgi:RNA polymerase sigma factor (sigma-70 family)
MEPDVIAWPGPREADPAAVGMPRAVSSDEVLAGLFSQHYAALVRLTVVLLRDRDLTAAEAVVQDAFVAIHRRRLRDPDEALACLRRAVVSGSRSVLRHRTRTDGDPLPHCKPGPEHRGIERLQTSAVAAALGTLPRRQCEAVILRFYADLSEAETATAMGISEGAASRHAHRGMAALRQQLDG